tara:strand:- start:405 stop:548 length:144 start_codon:yes stop_codon:yes gene_type:complete
MFFHHPKFPFKQKLALIAANEFQSQLENHPIGSQPPLTLGSEEVQTS